MLLLLTFLAGCATRPDVAQPRHSQPAGEIWGEQTVGQTFVAQKNGLNRVDVFLATYARDNTGPVTFHLRESPAAGQDLVTIQFDARDVQDNAYQTFTFPPQRNSQNRSYFFFLEAPAAKPGNAITVWASPTDTYSQGQAYLASQPHPGDLAFRTYAEYSITQIGRDLWRGLRRHTGTALLAILLFVVPGFGVLSLLYWGDVDAGWLDGWMACKSARTTLANQPTSQPANYSQSRDWELVVLAAGLSVAIAPLLILFASLAGLPLSRGPVIALLILLAILAVLPGLLRRRHPHSPAPPLPRSPAPPPLRPSPPSGSSGSSGTSGPSTPLLLAIFTISLATRLLVAQDLVAPMWGDSYHHTLIAQLLVDHGGLFQSWEPYAPLQSFTYHFGFHSNVALFHWLTGTPVLESVIIVGQIINALAPLMIYPFVRRLGGSSWAGLIAVLIASLLSPMPSGYVNWGRYTQLTGMVVLPVAATLTIDAIASTDRAWRRLALASIAVAGLALSHYLVTLLYLPLVLAYLAWWNATRIRHLCRRALRLYSGQAEEQGRQGDKETRRQGDRETRGQGDRDKVSPSPCLPLTSAPPHLGTSALLSALTGPWLRACAVGLIASILITPWILNLWRGRLPRMLAARLGSNPQSTYFQTAYNVVGDIFVYVPPWLIALAVAGAVWGCWQRRPLAIITIVWTALLILLANPNIIGLPGAGVVNNFTLIIALYLPLSILAGAGLAPLVEHSNTRLARGRLMAAGLVIVASLAGARVRLMDLDYRYRLVTPADQEAMQWIRDHTPEDARFLVNSFTAFGGHTVVGADAGWWIPYLAGRRTTVPPATYGMEASRNADYPIQVGTFYREIAAQPLNSPATIQVLSTHDVTHIYIGAVGGELLDPTRLERSPLYHLVYSRNGAMIFELTKTFPSERP
ncbi:MAG: DUF6541 family protein [Anaerolineae bacterium]